MVNVEPPARSLKDALREAGCEVGSYLDDLYVVAGPAAERTIAGFEATLGRRLARKDHVDRLTGKSWIGLPGALAQPVEAPEPPAAR